MEGLDEIIHIVSLGRCPERREFMVNQFSKLGLRYNLIEAVDGHDPVERSMVSVDQEAFRKIYGKNPTAGELGCYFSHLRAMEQILGSGKEYGIVMEDDVKITRTSEEIRRITEAQLTEMGHFDLFYPGKPIMAKTHIVTNVPEDEAPEHFLPLDKPPVGTQCYFVSARFAMFMVENWKTFYRPIDQAFRYIARCGRYDFKYFMAKREDWWVEHEFGFGSEVRK